MEKRELVPLLCLSSWCLVIVVWLSYTMPLVYLQTVIVVFPDHTHLLFLLFVFVFAIPPVCFLQPCGILLRSADLLAFLCVMLSCVFSLSHTVSWVRYGPRL